MSLQSTMPTRSSRSRTRLMAASAVAVVVVAAMALNTKVVRIGGAGDVNPGVFSPQAFGAAEFPKVKAGIQDRAIDLATLADAIAKDPAAATKQYSTSASGGPVFSVKFSGVVGQSDSGNYGVKVPGVPDAIKVQVQTGPAILGTDLRDATGTIGFNEFKNQIEYQNAGSALNRQMKKDILAKVDTAKLSGKTISVVGAFQMTDPKVWLVTPVTLDVQP